MRRRLQKRHEDERPLYERLASGPASPHEMTAHERVLAAGVLMNPGGGSLETSAAVQALHLICLEQQDYIDDLRDRVAALEDR